MNDSAFSGLNYLATPYSKYPEGVHIAFVLASQAAGRLVARGIHVYSPIAHTHPVAIYGNLDLYDHTLWLPLDEHFMDAAKRLLVVKMPGWDTSRGITHEIEFFRARQKAIYLLEWPSLEIKVWDRREGNDEQKRGFG